MNIVQQFSVKNDCYKNNVNKVDSRYTTFQARGPLGLMLHSIGCPQPKASVLINNWNKSGITTCVHGFIEPGGDVYQTLPWNYRGWHGGGDSNNTHIGIEMTEPSTIKYKVGANWEETADGTNTKKHVLAVYKTAVELFAFLCKEYRLDPLKDGVILSHKEGCARGIASNHGDPEHLFSKFGLSMNQFRQDVKAAMGGATTTPTTPTATETPTKTQASAFKGLSNADAAVKALELVKANALSVGIFPSVKAAQLILESGYVMSELAQAANNGFGMKTSLSGNTWPGTAWDGTSKYAKATQEQKPDGTPYTITADFRKYVCLEDSIADHSAYLLGAKNGSALRYAGIMEAKDYREQITIIKNGGYATDVNYVSKVCDVIKKWNLDRYDSYKTAGTVPTTPTAPTMVKEGDVVEFTGGAVYTSADAPIPAHSRPASRCKVTKVYNGKHPYHLISEDGKGVHGWVDVIDVATSETTATQGAFTPYTARVEIDDLSIREGPGTNNIRSGYTGKGAFTIVDEADGPGATKWGLLKAYQAKRNGWVSLDYTKEK